MLRSNYVYVCLIAFPTVSSASLKKPITVFSSYIGSQHDVMLVALCFLGITLLAAIIITIQSIQFIVISHVMLQNSYTTFLIQGFLATKGLHQEWTVS